MISRGKGLGIYKKRRQFCVTLFFAPKFDRVIGHLLLAARPIPLQHFARVAIGKNGLNPRGDISRIKADGACGRNRGQKRVSDAIFGNRLAQILIHLRHIP